MKPVKKVLLTAALAFTGCGYDGVGAPDTYVDCLQFKADYQIDAARLARDVEVARTVLSPLVPRSEFCGTFRNSVIEILDVSQWRCTNPTPCNSDGMCWGLKTFSDNIMLEYRTIGLAHELIHLWDALHGDNRSNHEQWEETGRNKMDQNYIDLYEPLWLPSKPGDKPPHGQ